MWCPAGKPLGEELRGEMVEVEVDVVLGVAAGFKLKAMFQSRFQVESNVVFIRLKF